MKTIKRVAGVGVLAMTLVLFSFDIPKGWFAAGSDPDSYEMGIDPGSGRDGKNAVTIKSIESKIKGFGTLMQESMPEKYLGKRVRMTGWMKTKDVSRWTGFWFRVDDQSSENSTGFDNMKDGKKDRSITGTTEWTKYEIVLDVPLSTANLAYGALLTGTGQIWFDDLQFEIVDKNIPTTGIGSEDLMPNKEPVNLDFEG